MTKELKAVLFGGAFILLILIGGIGYLSGKRNQKAKDALITKLITQNQLYETIHVGDNEIISRQEMRIMDLETAQRANLIDLKTLREKGVKDVQTIVNLKTEVVRLTLEACYYSTPETIHDTTIINGTATVKDYLRVPQPWKFEDNWLKVTGVVKTTGVTIDSLSSYSEPSIVLGYSTGFLKKSKPIVIFSDKNPYNIVRDMDNIVIYKKPVFYKRPWFYMLEGVAVVGIGAWTINQIK